ncbi:hypothetical protein LCGC14_1338220 [marine sediment metagenome]|uniref:Uncharacterized protein n=1 Tax=marine sediment metagenome TaxID=412755 RepID=A0A0F9KEA6_9ZZZZ
MAKPGDNINTFPVVPAVWLGDMVINLKRTNHQKFMDDRGTLIEAYEGDNLKELTENYFKSKTTGIQKSVPSAVQNLLDRAIRRMSLVYKVEPDYGTDKWPDGYDPMKRWLFMKSSERMANNIGTVLLRPVVRDGVMDYDLIWNWLPFFEGDPLTPTGILYSVVTSNVNDVPDIEWVFWTAEQLVVFDSSMKVKPQPENEDNENKFGILPFVTVNVRQGQGYWNWGYGNPLLDANTAINVALTEMRLGMRYTMMGQWVVTGVDEDTKIKLGVDQVVKLPLDAILEAKAPPAAMDDATTYIKAEFENAFQNIGLHVTWGESGGVPSGESLKVKNIELLERREDDLAVWLKSDRDLYEIEEIVWEKSDGTKGKLPKREVNFAEVEFPVSPEQQQARDEWDLDHGQITEAEILWRNDPDGYKSLEEAEKKVLDNKVKIAPQSGRSAFTRAPQS